MTQHCALDAHQWLDACLHHPHHLVGEASSELADLLLVLFILRRSLQPSTSSLCN